MLFKGSYVLLLRRLVHPCSLLVFSFPLHFLCYSTCTFLTLDTKLTAFTIAESYPFGSSDKQTLEYKMCAAKKCER